MGARLLADWLTSPLTAPRADRASGTRRSPSWSATPASAPTSATRSARRYDLERLAARVGTGRATPARPGRPWRGRWRSCPGSRPGSPPGARSGSTSSRRRSSSAPRSAPSIEAALVDDPPLALKEGGLIRDGLPPRPRRAPRDRPGAASRGSPSTRPSRSAGPGSRASRSASTRSSATTSRSPTPRRSEGPRRLHPQADGQERRAVHHARAEGVRGQGPPRRGPRLRAGIRAVHRPSATASRPRPRG